MDQNNLIQVVQHFRINGHSFNKKDANFKILERVGKDKNMKLIIKKDCKY